jgi:hypothetical protein
VPRRRVFGAGKNGRGLVRKTSDAELRQSWLKIAEEYRLLAQALQGKSEKILIRADREEGVAMLFAGFKRALA